MVLAGIVVLPLPLSAQEIGPHSSPRQTVKTLLGAIYQADKGDEQSMAEAIDCLDLTGVVSLRDEIGRRRVVELKIRLLQPATCY